MEYYDQDERNRQRPMKWYKFIIYFQLFASALMYLFSGGSYLLELKGNGLESLLWGTKWKVLCGIMAGMSFVIMACMLYTRHCLTMYKKGAPVKYLCCLGLTLLYAMFNIWAYAFVTGQFSFDGMDLLTLLEAVVMIVLNYIYFKKREYLFVY